MLTREETADAQRLKDMKLKFALLMASSIALVVLLGGCRGGLSAVESTAVDSAVVGSAAGDSAETDSDAGQDDSLAPNTETAPPTTEPAGTLTPTPAPTSPSAEPRPTPISPLLARVGSSPISGFAPDRGFGFFATHNGWDGPNCEGLPTEQLLTFTLDANNEPRYANANFVRHESLSMLEFGPNQKAAALLQCGDEWSMELVAFDDVGQYLSSSARIRLGPATWYNNIVWQSETAVTIDHTDTHDSTDVEEWEQVTTTIDFAAQTATPEVTEPWNPIPGFAQLAQSRDGSLTWFSGPDPSGALGCEASGTASTIFISATGSTEDAVPAIRDGSLFAWISQMQLGPDNLAVWTSECEGSPAFFAGRIGPDGNILDPHRIDLSGLVDPDENRWPDVRSATLDDEGKLLVLATSSAGETAATPIVASIDVNESPFWINTRTPAVIIDPAPIATSIDGTHTWHRGETTGPNPACGAQTLYRTTPDGHSRVMNAGNEIDTPLAVHTTETETVDAGLPFLLEARGVVVTTECPADYEGRRITGAIETVGGYPWLDWNLTPVGDPLVSIDEVLSVTRLQEGSFFGSWLAVDVRLRDGTTTTIELRQAPTG